MFAHSIKANPAELRSHIDLPAPDDDEQLKQVNLKRYIVSEAEELWLRIKFQKQNIRISWEFHETEFHGI